jgi:hypothetical protein
MPTQPNRDTYIKIYILCCLFPTADLTENAQSRYKTCSALLPICTAVTAVKALSRYCRRVLGCESNPHSKYSFSLTKLTPWRRALLEKLTTLAQTVRKFPNCYENRKFIAVFTRARYWSPF